MQYENQIAEMEQFLRDYGLEWIGNQAGEESDFAEDDGSGDEEKESDEEKVHVHLGVTLECMTIDYDSICSLF
jgi:hypothetical protein